MTNHRKSFLTAVLLICGSLSRAAATDTLYKDVVITALDLSAQPKTMTVSGEAKLKDVALPLVPSLEARLAQLHLGDHLNIIVTGDGATLTVSAIELEQSAVDWVERAGAFGASAVIWLLLFVILSRGKLLDLIMGEDGRYSNSKFQIVVWFSLLMVIYGAAVALRYLRLGPDFMWVNIPTHLFALSGLSTLTFAAAKGITASKVAAAPLAKSGNKSDGILQDLTTNDQNQIDLGDFQMLVVTLVAAASYIVIEFMDLGALKAVAGVSLKDVDTTILASFGLGQGAYLAKKALGQPALS